MRILLILCLFYANLTSAQTVQPSPLPQEQCVIHAPWGWPQGAASDVLICRRGYVTAANVTDRIPRWVSYVLTPDNALGCLERADLFAADQSLPIQMRAKPEDYARSGYDRGHLAPSGDMRWDKTVAVESFIMTNIAPQTSFLNRGIWKALENAVRGWVVARQHNLLVVAGPILAAPSKQIRNTGIRVPQSFFKVVLDTATGEFMGFVMPQRPSAIADLAHWRKPLTQIELLSSVKLSLPPNAVELPLGSIWPQAVDQYISAKVSRCGHSVSQ